MWTKLKRIGEAGPSARDNGALYALQLIFRNVVSQDIVDFNSWAVWKIDLQATAGRVCDEPDIRWARPGDIDALTALGRPGEEFTGAFSCGRKIAVCECQGQIVGYYLVSTTSYERLTWLSVTVPPKCAYGLMLWTQPRFRGRSIGPRLVRFVQTALAREGYRSLIYHIDAMNRISLRANAKLDVGSLGRITYIRFMGLTYLRYRSMRRVGFWNAYRRLELALS